MQLHAHQEPCEALTLAQLFREVQMEQQLEQECELQEQKSFRLLQLERLRDGFCHQHQCLQRLKGLRRTQQPTYELEVLHSLGLNLLLLE
jgi:hypothetical protein